MASARVDQELGAIDAASRIPAFLDLTILAKLGGAGEVDGEDDLHTCRVPDKPERNAWTFYHDTLLHDCDTSHFRALASEKKCRLQVPSNELPKHALWNLSRLSWKVA